MVNKSKIKGTAAETRVVRFLVAMGLDADRVALKGTDDEGDIHIVSPDGSYRILIEVKAGKQTTNISRAQREDWLAETRREARALQERTGQSSVPAYLVIAKHGSSACDYLVWSDNGRNFCYLDQLTDYPIVRGVRRQA